MIGTPLPDRMKLYERASAVYLTPRMPMIVRVDGRAFHTLTRGMEAPWDADLRDAMTAVGVALIDDIAGAKMAYLQSDEVSVLVTDYDALGTQAWFDKSLQKVASVSASVATVAFNDSLNNPNKRGTFDSRVFTIPREEVCNYFIWRQQDATRNSVSSLAQHHFSHKSLQGVSGPEMQERLFREKGVNWNDCATWQKRGWCVFRGGVEDSVPVFTADREFIERHVSPGAVEGDMLRAKEGAI